MCCSSMRELAVLLRMQGEYPSSKLRPHTYALICRRQEAAGTAADGLRYSAEAWETAVLDMSRQCREARDAQAAVLSGLPSGINRVRLAVSCTVQAAHWQRSMCQCHCLQRRAEATQSVCNSPDCPMDTSHARF